MTRSQRYKHRKGQLSQKHVVKLNEIGFEWDGRIFSTRIKKEPSDPNKQWRENFERFKAYSARYGPAVITVVGEETKKLNRWMLYQRQSKMRGKLSEERINALNEIGFIWQRKARNTRPHAARSPTIEVPISRTWDEMLSELIEFFKLHGHCNVPGDWTSQPELASWVTKQRHAKRQNQLTPDQVRQMEEIGFAWSTHDGGWDAMFAKLIEHMRPMNNGKPRKVSPSGELKRWVMTQRQMRKRGDLDPEREKRLTSIGFEWDPFASRWHKMLAALKQFHEKHGHCRVPAGWVKNPPLANWVGVQRARKINGNLSPERQRELDALGFTWRLGDCTGKRGPQDAWSKMFDRLIEFHAKHGHAKVPQVYPPDQKLGWWVTTQRRNRRKGKLTPKQISILDRLGFIWSPFGSVDSNGRWQKMLAALKTFKEQFGHCRVPAGWKENPQLANWVAVQRRQKKHALLDPRRIAALDEVGFEWRVERAKLHPVQPHLAPIQQGVDHWEAMFQELLSYKQSYGDCLVPLKWEANRRLGDWVSSQRTAYKRQQLSPDRVQRLEEIDFNWDPIGTHWEGMFQQLVDFKREHGHTNVPQGSHKYAALGTWVRSQRAAKRYNRPIIAQRGKRLEEIGFSWRIVEQESWDSMFERLVQFKKAHGHCNVPQRWPADRKLGRWVNTIRHRSGRLKEHQIKQLESIGFVWNTKRSNFEAW